MRKKPGCHLTTKDLTILEGMLDRLERQGLADTATAQLLRHKLSVATVSFRDDIDPCAATINSRIEFRVGDGPVQSRILTHGGENALPGAALPISTLRGLALLGLTEGESIAIATSDGRTETLHIERVADQPESTRRRKVYAATPMVRKPVSTAGLSFTDDDDPGPQAA